MKIKGISYPVALCLLTALCAFPLLFVGPFAHAELKTLYHLLSRISVVVSLLLAFAFHRWGRSDKLSIFYFISSLASILSLMWFVPLLEVAYLLCAIGAAFLPLQRKWLYPVIFGAGIIGMLVCYHLQDQIGWKLPTVSRTVWVFVTTIFFFLSWFIQKFAIGTFRKKQDRIQRFGLIGRETTRLIHDIKGLISSPMMLIETLNRQPHQVSATDYSRNMKLLAADMRNVHEVIRAIHRLVLIDDHIVQLDILEAAQGAVRALQRRLRKVELTWPESKRLLVNPDRLHSAFFNLFLLAIEQIEARRSRDSSITMKWEETTLHFVVRFSTSDDQATTLIHNGLGSGLLKEDLRHTGADLFIETSADSIFFQIRWAKEIFQ